MPKGGGFPGMMGGANLQQIARQTQKLQQQMAKMQEEIEERVFEASSGGGMVTASVNGKKELLSLKINPDVVEDGDVEMIEDLVVAAVNTALTEAGDTLDKEMGKLTGGLNLPGLF